MIKLTNKLFKSIDYVSEELKTQTKSSDQNYSDLLIMSENDLIEFLIKLFDIVCDMAEVAELDEQNRIVIDYYTGYIIGELVITAE